MKKETVLIFVFFSFLQLSVFGQKSKVTDTPNLDHSYKLNDILFETSIDVEYRIDSLILHSKNDHFIYQLREYKINVIHQLQQTLLRGDPVFAIYDGWTLGIQLNNYLMSDKVKSTYPDEAIALFIDLNNSYVSRLENYHNYITNSEKDKAIINLLYQFADKNPILNPYLNRKPITTMYLSQIKNEHRLNFAVVNDAAEAVRGVNAKINYLTKYAPKLTQWQLEQVFNKALYEDSAFSYIDRSVDGIEFISTTIKTSVDQIDDQIDSVVTKQRKGIYRDILQIEGKIFKDLEQQRKETQIFASAQKDSIANIIRTERTILVRDFEKSAERVVKSSKKEALEVIDYTFDKIYITLAILFVGLITAIILYKKL